MYVCMYENKRDIFFTAQEQHRPVLFFFLGKVDISSEFRIDQAIPVCIYVHKRNQPINQSTATGNDLPQVMTSYEFQPCVT